MTISNSTASYSSQVSSYTSRPQGPPPKVEDRLASALKSIGVDESTTANVLEQVGEALSTLQAESPSGRPSREAVQSAVSEILEANGVDSAKVEEALEASGPSRSGRPARAGRPNGPPPPPKQDEGETSTVESALLSAGAEESSVDDLVSQVIETIQELRAGAEGDVSQEELQSVLTSLFGENGVDFSAFEQAIGNKTLGATGSFLNLVA